MHERPTVGSLFAGIGGLDLGLERAGFRVVWQCEADPYARRVLARHWPDIPCYPDVRALGCDVPRVDLLCGGFPCQDLSVAGKRAGIDGARSGLWAEFARTIGLLRPRLVLVENVPGILAVGLGRVLGDLAELGFDAEWSTVSACAVGAAHLRRRVFVVAYPHGFMGGAGIGNYEDRAPAELRCDHASCAESCCETRLARLADLYRTPDGVSDRLDRTRTLGNAVVPQVAEWIGRQLLRRLITAAD